MAVPQDDEGSFAAGRQALLEALSTLEQRAQDRAERMVRDAERASRQLNLESEQRAYQLTTDAEERARRARASPDSPSGGRLDGGDGSGRSRMGSFCRTRPRAQTATI